MRELENNGERRGFKSSFNLTDIGSMDPCLKAEFLLRKPAILAKPADLFA